MRGADYAIKRTAFAIVTIFVAVTVNFALFRLAPGSAVSNLSRVPHATPQLRLALTKQFGLDKSKGEQYVLYLKQLLHGNLGVSFANEQPVSSNLRTAIGNTLPMVFLGTILAIIVGTLTGVIAAWRRGTALESATVTTALGFYSMPTHWLGLMLVILFAGVLPTGGMTNEFLFNPSWWTHVKDVLSHMVLPSLTLGLVLFGEYTLIVRSAMLETLGEDYILTARAKGLRPWTIVRRHALRNAALPIVTLVALSLG
ncbi:MAG: ABC transporter permease, partial [Gaiellaceae bacterium]